MIPILYIFPHVVWVIGGRAAPICPNCSYLFVTDVDPCVKNCPRCQIPKKGGVSYKCGCGSISPRCHSTEHAMVSAIRDGWSIGPPYLCPSCQKWTFGRREDESYEDWDDRLGCVKCGHKHNNIPAVGKFIWCKTFPFKHSGGGSGGEVDENGRCTEFNKPFQFYIAGESATDAIARLGCLTCDFRQPGFESAPHCNKVKSPTARVDPLTGKCLDWKDKTQTMGDWREKNRQESVIRGCTECWYANSTHFNSDTWPCVGTSVVRPPEFDSNTGKCLDWMEKKVWNLLPENGEDRESFHTRLGCHSGCTLHDPGGDYWCAYRRDTNRKEVRKSIDPDTGKCLEFKDKKYEIIKCCQCQGFEHVEPEGGGDWTCPKCLSAPWSTMGWHRWRSKKRCWSCQHHKHSDTGSPSPCPASESDGEVGVWGWCNLVPDEKTGFFGKSRSLNEGIHHGQCLYWTPKLIEIPSNFTIKIKVESDHSLKIWHSDDHGVVVNPQDVQTFISALASTIPPEDK